VSIEPVDVIHYTDPGCPWAYSAEPFFTTLRYRYDDGLRWRRVMIGLSETHERYDRDGYQPVRSARNRSSFARRFGMPLRFGYFATPLLMDTDEGIAAMAETVAGLDVARLIAEIDDPAVEEAYRRDWAETRTADENGRPGVAQGKTANTDGAERFTAPSIVFRRGDRELAAVGWQSLDAYDVCVANLAPELPRRATPTPAELLPHFPHGLTTQEVAVACTADLKEVDRESTLRDLVTLVAEGAARRRDVGDDALWIPV
jgi:2-hydroxychromene-2-carboxylate isomerase